MAVSVRDALGFLRRNRPRVVGQVARVLATAVATGRDAAAVAKELATYANPWHATRRNAAGTPVRAGRGTGGWPAAPGMATQHHRLVMLTESSAAHGSATVRDAGNRGRFVKWQLGSRHPRLDECDAKATADSGFGRGVYRPSDVPPYPSHGRCRCFLTVVLPEDAR